MFFNNPGYFAFDYTDKKRVEYNFFNRRIINKVNDVVFIGDSITEYYNLDKLFAPLNVVNRGISGDISLLVAKRFNSDCIQLKPKKVFILCGVNDLGFCLENDPMLGSFGINTIVAGIINNIKYMCQMALENNIKPYIGLILPVAQNQATDNEINDCIKQINAKLIEYGQKAHITVLDYFSLFEKDGKFNRELGEDGLHPNEKGYELMTKLIQEYIYEDLNN